MEKPWDNFSVRGWGDEERGNGRSLARYTILLVAEMLDKEFLQRKKLPSYDGKLPLFGTRVKQEREGESLRSGSKTQGPLQTESHFPCLSGFLCSCQKLLFS